MDIVETNNGRPWRINNVNGHTTSTQNNRSVSNNHNASSDARVLLQGELVPIPMPTGQTSQASRAELVRLLADGLRDLGYLSSAEALESESGTRASSDVAAEFLALLQAHRYDSALVLLDRLPFKDGAIGRKRARNFIVQERYLDSLLHERVDEALNRLHQEVYLLHQEDESDLDELAALLACPTFDDLVHVSGRLRAKQARRYFSSSSADKTFGEKSAIDCIRALLDSDAVVPPQRLLELMGQSLAHQIAASDSSSVVGNRRFDQTEPMPLLRQISEVEKLRNAQYAPSVNCRAHVLVAVANEEEEEENEVWCMCFHASCTKFAVGTAEGTVIIYELDLLTMKAQETARHDNVCGGGTDGDENGRPIVALDWAREGEDEGALLCVSKQQPKKARVLSQASSSSVDGEDRVSSEEEEEEDAQQMTSSSSALVQAILTKSKHTFPCSDVFHAGNPCAVWAGRDSSKVCTAGPDGWYRVWRLSASTYACTASLAVERVVDMAFSDRLQAVFLACADSTIRAFQDARQLLVISTSEPVVSIHAGLNTLVACLKSPVLAVWNLNDISSSSLTNEKRMDTPVTLTGLPARKRFVLKPSVGCGDFIACGGEDGAVHVWSGGGGASEVVVLKGHTTTVNQVCFSTTVPGLLVSASDDGSVRIWSRKTAEDEDEDLHVD